ncbi:MAG TPA: hypothetical protein PLO53_08280 [Candidatus Hydrogenedentes bacterium]|nr:hypothetical protein [Candidatus Hydrogenedentota bacterium]
MNSKMMNFVALSVALMVFSFGLLLPAVSAYAEDGAKKACAVASCCCPEGKCQCADGKCACPDCKCENCACAKGKCCAGSKCAMK